MKAKRYITGAVLIAALIAAGILFSFLPPAPEQAARTAHSIVEMLFGAAAGMILGYCILT